MNRLRELRLKHGYKTQKDLADVLFVNQTAVSQWERGATVPSSQMLVKLSELYGVTIDYILGGSEQKETPAQIPQDRNVVQIAGRDGSFVERELTDEQAALMKSMLDQLKPVNDENV